MSSKDTSPQFDQLLASSSPEIRELALRAREIIHENIPGINEEVDLSAKLLGFTFIPRTYKGMPVAIILQNGYINVMFANGVELANIDTAHLLEGTGKQARHIKVRSLEDLNDPSVVVLIRAAAARAQRIA